jgi:hypothetical protein
MIKHTEQAIEHGVGYLHDRKLAFEGPIGRFSYTNEIWSGSNRISAHGNCHALPKQLQCPHTVTVYSARVIGHGLFVL